MYLLLKVNQNLQSSKYFSIQQIFAGIKTFISTYVFLNNEVVDQATPLANVLILNLMSRQNTVNNLIILGELTYVTVGACG